MTASSLSPTRVTPTGFLASVSAPTLRTPLLSHLVGISLSRYVFTNEADYCCPGNPELPYDVFHIFTYLLLQSPGFLGTMRQSSTTCLMHCLFGHVYTCIRTYTCFQKDVCTNDFRYRFGSLLPAACRPTTLVTLATSTLSRSLLTVLSAHPVVRTVRPCFGT